MVKNYIVETVSISFAGMKANGFVLNFRSFDIPQQKVASCGRILKKYCTMTHLDLGLT